MLAEFNCLRIYLHIGVGKAIFARANGVDPRSRYRGSKQSNVALLILSDAAQVIIVSRVVASGSEVTLRELVEGSNKEGVLQMLKLNSLADDSTKGRI